MCLVVLLLGPKEILICYFVATKVISQWPVFREFKFRFLKACICKMGCIMIVLKCWELKIEMNITFFLKAVGFKTKDTISSFKLFRKRTCLIILHYCILSPLDFQHKELLFSMNSEEQKTLWVLPSMWKRVIFKVGWEMGTLQETYLCCLVQCSSSCHTVHQALPPVV